MKARIVLLIYSLCALIAVSLIIKQISPDFELTALAANLVNHPSGSRVYFPLIDAGQPTQAPAVDTLPAVIQPVAAAQTASYGSPDAPWSTATPDIAPTPQPAIIETVNEQPITPTFINHPQSEMTSCMGAFTFGGCDPYTGYCAPDSAVGALGCQRVIARDLLGGLEPALPLAWCLVESGVPADDTHFRWIGGDSPYYLSYVMMDEYGYSLIDQFELQSRYAPIESPAEAVSYALLQTQYDLIYNQGYLPYAQYFVQIIEDSHVEQTELGYQVRLYDQDNFDACQVITYAVDLLVAYDGRLIILAQTPLYLERLCV